MPARLLLVDDSPTIIEMLCAHLGPESHGLLAAPDGVIADLLMPDLSRVVLVRQVHATAPALARGFVFVTGSADPPEVRAFLEGSRCPVPETPIGGHDLRQPIASRAGASGR